MSIKTGQIKSLCDQIVSAANTYGSNIDRTNASYYQYGQTAYNQFVGTVPQLRIKPTDGVTTRSEIQPGYGITSSLLTMNQNIEMTFWAESEAGCHRELSYFVAGLQKLSLSSTEQMSQPLIFDNLTYSWADTQGVVTNGELLICNFVLKHQLKLPSAYYDYVLVNSMSLAVSQSTVQGNSISGSYELIKQKTITSSS